MTDTFDYSSIRATALGLVKSFGRACVLLRKTEATAADPTKPWRVGDGTTTTFPFQGVCNALSFPRLSNPIIDGDADIMMPGDLGIEPTLNDRIQVLGSFINGTDQIYMPLGIHVINPDGNAIVYKMRCAAWANITQQAATPI